MQNYSDSGIPKKVVLLIHPQSNRPMTGSENQKKVLKVHNRIKTLFIVLYHCFFCEICSYSFPS